MAEDLAPVTPLAAGPEKDGPDQEAMPAPRPTASGWYAVEGDIVRGWCRDRLAPGRRLTVAIRIDGGEAGTALADRANPRLANLGESDTRLAFAFAVPERFRDGLPHDVEVGIATPGYEGVALKTKSGSFALAEEAAPPRVALRGVSAEGFTGTLAGTGLREELDVWLEGRRLGESEVAVEWGFGDRASRPFTLRFPALQPLRLVFRDLVLCYPGMREAGMAEGVGRLLDAEVEAIGGTAFELRLTGGLRLADGTTLTVEILAGEGGDERLAQREVALARNAGRFDLPDLAATERMRVRLATRDGERIGPDRPFTYAHLARRLLANGTFARWNEGGPAGFDIPGDITCERGFHAFPPALKAQRHLSGHSCIIGLDAGGEPRPLLSQRLWRSNDIGREAVELGLGLFARASHPAALTLRLRDTAGIAIDLATTLVGSRWQEGWPTALLQRGDLTGTLTLEVAAHLAGDAGERGFVELAGLHCGQPGVDTFADAPAPAVAAPTGTGNLVANADLLRWPGGLAIAAQRVRFEAAEGWQVYNRGATATMHATAVPAPGRAAGRYALSLVVAHVPEVCRLEIMLEAARVDGSGTLSFEARCDPLPGAGADAGPWNAIERILLIRRESRMASGRASVQDRTIARIARRVVLTRRWEHGRFAFAALAADVGFDPADDGNVTVDHLLAFEFARPVAFAIHAVDLRLGGGPAPEPAPPPGFEDANIAAQIGVLRGFEGWRSPALQHASHPAPPATAPTPLRWSWSRAALGTVAVAICVHNAADETLACLSSLVGSSAVPHVVRIVDDGSDEDCRRRIAAFIADKPWMTLVENNANRGYTASANRAVAEADADWVILLNSDTIVSPGWIEGLLDVVASDASTAMVGPVSNAASYQSVPELHDGTGKWAVNPLPAGWTAADMAGFVAGAALRAFPEVPLLNGFCTLIRRAVFTAVGGFDEAAFPAGYGEENDLCLRVAEAGHRLRVADHVYVFHAKSASFGHSRRAELARAGDRALRALHPEVDLAALGRRYAGTPALVALRAAVRGAYAPVPLRRGKEA